MSGYGAALSTQSRYVDPVAVEQVVTGRAHMGILREAEQREVVRIMALRGDTTYEIVTRREPGTSASAVKRRVERWRAELRAAGALPQVVAVVDDEQCEPVEIARTG